MRTFQKQFEIVFLERSHAVLSMIFGIFGKFGIEIGDPNCFGRNIFRRKKIVQFFLDHLFRSQVFHRFQKSYLEQRTIILKIRTARTKKIDPPILTSEGYQFHGSSVYSNLNLIV